MASENNLPATVQIKITATQFHFSSEIFELSKVGNSIINVFKTVCNCKEFQFCLKFAISLNMEKTQNSANE